MTRLHCLEQSLSLGKYHAKQNDHFLAQGDGVCGGDLEIGYLQAAKVPGTRPFPIAYFLSQMIINLKLRENFSQSLDLYRIHLIVPIPSIQHPDLLRPLPHPSFSREVQEPHLRGVGGKHMQKE
jgi:hypothetical protein